MLKKAIIFLFICTLMLSFNALAKLPPGWDHLKPFPNVWFTPSDFGQLPQTDVIPDDTVNVRLNSDQSGQIQNEQQVWINPANADNVVAVWRDFREGYRRVGVGYSMDGGLTWHDELFPVDLLPRHSDPCLTYDVEGNFYAMVLSFEFDSYNGFEVFKSSDGGITWSDPTWAIYSDPDVFEDKEMFTCDRAPDSPYQGNLYCAWTRFSENMQRTDVAFIKSEDGNQSWEPEIVISDFTTLQWPLPVVGAGGIVYVAWVSFMFSELHLDRSFDGGDSWGTDIKITDVSTPYTVLNGDISTFPYPAMDADITGGQYHGNLYLAYMDWTQYDFDIYFRKSDDQGDTWSSPERINDDEYNTGCDQFHPWLTVDENGVITVMFYDRRDDDWNLEYHIYLTQSFDGGETWTENIRVTTVPSDPTSGGDILAGLIGEYSGVAVKNGVANLVWTDFRNGDQDTYGARIPTYTVSGVEDETPVPRQTLLISNYPNPFNSTTSIRFNVPERANVELTAYDLTGRKVGDIAKRDFMPGYHSINWSPEELSSGIYLIRLKTDAGVSTRKTVYLK
ncbi:MAG: T9SS type A sorting domain-containing protein [candidate division Zixibacteria bacterium]|nr:T9SS type A sorting domain-containing protein [candidate division Zixibacteria bacterium]